MQQPTYQQPQQQNSVLNCPHCGSSDQVLKVSAIVQAGTATTTTTSRSAGVGVANVGGTWGTGVGGGKTQSQSHSATNQAQSLMPPTKPASSVTPGLVTGLLVVAAIIGYLGGGIGWVIGILLVVGVLALMIPRDQARMKVELPLWERMMQKWRELYYCQRSDCVFIPGQQSYAPLSQMNSFIAQ